MSSTGVENLVQPSRSLDSLKLPAAHRLRSDQEAIQTAHQIARELEAEASVRDREWRLPHAEIELLTRSGLWGITIPKAFGGPGVSHCTLVEVFPDRRSGDQTTCRGSVAPADRQNFGRSGRSSGRSDSREGIDGGRGGQGRHDRNCDLATNKLFELAGTQSTLGKYNLDRHWRNARTHTLHDPVRWKYYAIGNYYLNNVNPPRHPWN
jgi:alkylation response protein AidB-like acyl-CoA dehydrogenase